MYAGLDFGTSNSALGIWEDNQPKLLSLDNGSRFIVTVHQPRLD